ncbi:hypothetical protein HBH77_178430 [Parastagonospora nodorum]|nr:hypothetical protein HBH77_178430 [Parastagonospora nodorum]
MTDSPRARTPINPSAVLYEQSAARPSLPAEVGNMDLDFVPSVAFIPNVHIANSLRARTPINPSAVLYEQAAARTGLPAEVGNIDLNFVPGVAFIPNVHIADSLRARTLINPSAVLYEQAAARTGLPAKVGNISPRARTLINPSAVLYEQADARSGLPAEVGIIDLNFVPGVAFDAMGNVELTGDFPTALLNPRSLASKRPASSSSDLNRGRTDPTIAGQISLVKQLHNVQERTASPAKRIKTDENRKKSTHRQGFNSSSSLELQKTSSQAPSQTGPSINLTISDDDDVQLVGDNIEELICVSKVKHTYVQAHTVPYPDPKKYLGNSSQQGRIKVSFRRAGNNHNNLNIIVTDPTGREFSRMAWTDIRRKQAGEGPPGLPFSGLISMTLQLYCKQKWAHNIGKFHKGKNIQLLRPVFKLQRYDYYNPQDSDSLTRIQAIDPSFQTDQFTQQGPTPREPGSIYVLRSVDEIRADVANVFDTVISKSDKDKEQDHSAEEHDQRKDTLWAPRLRDNSRKFYHLVITSEDTHCKQTIKKAYIMSPERASLILFMT